MSPRRLLRSLLIELLDFLVQCRALFDGYEALHTELSTGLGDRIGPLADSRCIALLRQCRPLLAHDPAGLVLDEIFLLQGCGTVSVAAPECNNLCKTLARLHHQGLL